jgi:hypothetical protein
LSWGQELDKMSDYMHLLSCNGSTG